MSSEAGSREAPMLSPEETFGVLGDETRLEILRALGEADGPLSYSALFDRIDYDDTSNFSYHLDKLVDHFIAKTDGRYTLRRPGERVMEAVLSGAVTDNPVRKRRQTDKPCPFCGAPIEVGYQRERVTMHCPECSGLSRHTDTDNERFAEFGNLGFRPLPPAGVKDRTAGELHEVSGIWTATSMQAISRNVCPRCSGPVEHTVNVCDAHDPDEGTCEACGIRFGATASATCTNCIFDMEAPIPGHLSVRPRPMGFLIYHGIDPVAPEEFHPFAAVEETILAHEPFEARYTFTVDGDALSLTVDGDLSVVEVSRGKSPESD